MKVVLDSSSLITFSDNCLIKILKHLSEKEGIEFIIPQSVYIESVETPLKIKRFELNAIRIRDAVEEGFIKVVKTSQNTSALLARMERITHDLCSCQGKPIRLVHAGEAETLALIREINAGILAIDERTTRMLIEEPQNIMRFLEKRHQCKVVVDAKALEEFRGEFGGIRIVRSVELVALAYADGAFQMEIHGSKQALEAALYAAKFAGCAVSFNEIEAYVKRVKQ